MSEQDLIKMLLTDVYALCDEINIISASRGASTCIKIASSKSKNLMKKYNSTEYSEIIKKLIAQNEEDTIVNKS